MGHVAEAFPESGGASLEQAPGGPGAASSGKSAREGDLPRVSFPLRAHLARAARAFAPWRSTRAAAGGVAGAGGVAAGGAAAAAEAAAGAAGRARRRRRSSRRSSRRRCEAGCGGRCAPCAGLGTRAQRAPRWYTQLSRAAGNIAVRRHARAAAAAIGARQHLRVWARFCASCCSLPPARGGMRAVWPPHSGSGSCARYAGAVRLQTARCREGGLLAVARVGVQGLHRAWGCCRLARAAWRWPLRRRHRRPTDI